MGTTGILIRNPSVSLTVAPWEDIMWNIKSTIAQSTQLVRYFLPKLGAEIIFSFDGTAHFKLQKCSKGTSLILSLSVPWEEEDSLPTPHDMLDRTLQHSEVRYSVIICNHWDRQRIWWTVLKLPLWIFFSYFNELGFSYSIFWSYSDLLTHYTNKLPPSTLYLSYCLFFGLSSPICFLNALEYGFLFWSVVNFWSGWGSLSRTKERSSFLCYLCLKSVLCQGATGGVGDSCCRYGTTGGRERKRKCVTPTWEKT